MREISWTATCDCNPRQPLFARPRLDLFNFIFSPFPQQPLKSVTAFLHGNRRSTINWPVSFIAELKQGVHRGFYCGFFNKWDILVGSVSSCFMFACFFGRLKYKTSCQINFIYWRNMILFYPIIKREHKKTCSKWRKLCSLRLGWKGKIKTCKTDYYTFHQTFIFPQNQLLPSLQQHWCWRLLGLGYHCVTELNVCRLYLDTSLLSFWC